MLTAKEITIIILASGNAEKLATSLESLKEQSDQFSETIIVLPVMEETSPPFRALIELAETIQDYMTLTWLTSSSRADRDKRELALNELSDKTTALLFLDEGVKLAPDALSNLIYFWNSQMATPAGVGVALSEGPAVNEVIDDSTPDSESMIEKIQSLLKGKNYPPGSLLPSGAHIPLEKVNKSRRTEWLPNRAVLWRRDIISAYALPKLAANTSLYEDLLFSYSVGKNEPLFICAAAKGICEKNEFSLDFKAARHQGEVAVLRRNLLVNTYSVFKYHRFMLLVLEEIISHCAKGVRGEREEFGQAIGKSEALFKCVKARLLKRSAISICK